MINAFFNFSMNHPRWAKQTKRNTKIRKYVLIYVVKYRFVHV